MTTLVSAMAKSVEQINRELAALEEQSQELGQALRGLYGNYLAELGQVTRQQLTSVCYQLCTQLYPESFLKLSYRGRDRLQRQIRQCSQALQERLELEQLFQPDESELEALEASLVGGLHFTREIEPLEDLSERRSDPSGPELAGPGSNGPGSGSTGPGSTGPGSNGPRSTGPDHAASSHSGWDLHAPDLNLSGLELSEAEAMESAAIAPPFVSLSLSQRDGEPLSPGVLASAIAAEAEADAEERPSTGTRADSSQSEPTAPKTPQDMLAWQERVERAIAQRMRQSSQEMTRLLEKSGVLSNQLPDGLLAPGPHLGEEEGDGETLDSERRRRPKKRTSLSPHILSLTLEPAGDPRKRKAKGDDGAGPPEGVQIVAIYLRLTEIEFAMPLVMGWRNHIRTKAKEMQRLAHQYEEKLRERAIAEAEAAWRSTWSND